MDISAMFVGEQKCIQEDLSNDKTSSKMSIEYYQDIPYNFSKFGKDLLGFQNGFEISESWDSHTDLGLRFCDKNYFKHQENKL